MKLKQVSSNAIDNTVRIDDYISSMGLITDVVKNKYGLSVSKENRPNDYFDSFEHNIKIGDLGLEISGKGREETIKAFKNGIPLVDENLLNMNGTISNQEFDDYLKEKNTPEYTTKSIFVHDKKDKDVNDKEREKEFLNNAFNDKTILKLKEGFGVVIPIRKNNKYDDRAGHWCNLRLTLKDNELSPVLENTTAEANNKSLEEIKNDYKRSVVQPIASFLQDEKKVYFSLKEMDYLETKQYGNMGCGITTAKNILDGRSSNRDNYLQSSDQTEKIEKQEDWQIEIGFPANKTFSLNESGQKKSLSSNLVLETLMRVDIKHVLEYRHSYEALSKTTDGLSPNFPNVFLEESKKGMVQSLSNK